MPAKKPQSLPPPPPVPRTRLDGSDLPGVPALPLPPALRPDVFGNRPVMGAPVMPEPMALYQLGSGLLTKLDTATHMGQPGVLGAPMIPKPNAVPNTALSTDTSTTLQGGPDIRLNEFHANRGGFASPARLVITSSRPLASKDIEQNFFQGHDISVQKLTPSVFTGQGNPDTQLFHIQFHAPDGSGRHISAPAGIEESLGLRHGERFVDKPATGMPGQRSSAPASQPIIKGITGKQD